MKLTIKYSLLILIAACNITFLVATTAKTQKETSKKNGFKKLYTLKGHTGAVLALKVLKNGLLVSGSVDSTMRLWDKEGACAKCLYTHAGRIDSVEELTDGRIVNGSNEGIVNLWNYKNDTHNHLPNLAKENKLASSVIQLHNGSIAFNTWHGSIKIWDIDKDVCLKEIDPDQHWASIGPMIELKNTNYLATISWDNIIKIWDISHEKAICVKTLFGHADCVNIIRQLNDQLLVSAAEDATVMIWNIDSSDSTATLRGHKDRVCALAAADGLIVSGAHNETVKIWDPTSINCIMTIPVEGKIFSLEYSPHEKRIFVGLGSGDIEVYELN